MLRKTPAPVSTCLCCWKSCSCPSWLPLPLSLPLLPLLPAPSQPTGCSPPVLPARLAKTVFLSLPKFQAFHSPPSLFLAFKTESVVFLWHRAASVSPQKSLPQLTRKLLRNNNKG